MRLVPGAGLDRCHPSLTWFSQIWSFQVKGAFRLETETNLGLNQSIVRRGSAAATTATTEATGA
jgi:hypothetical protein